MAKCALQFYQTFKVWFRCSILPMHSLKELCGVTQLFKGNSELVAGLRRQSSKVRTFLECAAVQSCQNPFGE